MWNIDEAVAHLDSHAKTHSLGRCAEFVRKAIEAGGVHLIHHISAKDYGTSLTLVGFRALPSTPPFFVKGDVAIIQPINGHPHGHMTMFNGAVWVSDFKQLHGFYPGPSYRSKKPSVQIYRYPNFHN